MKRRVGGVVVLASVAMMSVGATSAARSADPVGRRSFTLGRSIGGRPITVIETGDRDNPAKTLVVGCIHGNECAGIAIADSLARTARPGEADLWIVPDLDPDGAAVSAVTRTAST